MKQLLSDLLAEPDQRHADEMALIAVLGCLTFLGLSIYAVWRGALFDAQAFGTGFGIMVGSAAAGMGIKSKLEAPPKDKAGP